MGQLLGYKLRSHRYPNANLHQSCTGLRWSTLFRPIFAFVYGEHASRWRLVRLERVLGERMRHEWHPDADVQQPLAGLRRQRLHWRGLAVLHREQP